MSEKIGKAPTDEEIIIAAGLLADPKTDLNSVNPNVQDTLKAMMLKTGVVIEIDFVRRTTTETSYKGAKHLSKT